jgi:iron complex outermembrane recepter protein
MKEYCRLTLLAFLIPCLSRAATPEQTQITNPKKEGTELEQPADTEVLPEMLVSEQKNNPYVATQSKVATKMDTPILETPQSVSVITHQQLIDQAVMTLQDAARYSAGISATNGQSTNYDVFKIRGFEASESNIFRDGARNVTNVYDSTVEPYALESVEILKGPASVLYGQAAPGGVMNLTTKRPTEDAFGELQLTYGSFERSQAAFDMGGPIDSAGHFQYRLTALVRDSNTFIDYSKDNRIYVAPAFTWKPSEDTTVSVLTSYQKSEATWNWGLPAYGTLLDNPNGKLPINRYTGEPDFDQWDTEKFTAGYLLDHQFNETLSFHQVARLTYGELAWDYAYGSSLESDLRTLKRFAYSRRDQSKLATIDSRLQAHWSSRWLDLTLSGGVDVMYMEWDRRQKIGTVASLDIYDPDYGSAVTLPDTDSGVYDTDDTMVGVYSQAQIKLAEKWSFLLGGRYDWVNSDFDYNGTSSDTDPEAFSGRAGLVYLSDLDLSPYVSYSDSFEPVTGADFNGAPFEPKTAQQWETGIKYQPADTNLLITASIYDLTQQNVSTTDPNHSGYSIQKGEIRARGVELEGRYSFNETLEILAAYTYTDAEITKSNSGDEGFTPGDLPEHMASAWIDYTFRDSTLKGLGAGLGVRYIGKTTSTDYTIDVPDYTLFDAVVHYEMEHWRFALNVKNLLDKEYVTNSSYSTFYGEPRNIIASVTYRW